MRWLPAVRPGDLVFVGAVPHRLRSMGGPVDVPAVATLDDGTTCPALDLRTVAHIAADAGRCPA